MLANPTTSNICNRLISGPLQRCLAHNRTHHYLTRKISFTDDGFFDLTILTNPNGQDVYVNDYEMYAGNDGEASGGESVEMNPMMSNDDEVYGMHEETDPCQL